MSADNYYLVRRNPAGGFSPVMGFGSWEEKPTVEAGAPVFGTPELALASVLGEYAEYGHSIDPECFESTAPLQEAQDALGAGADVSEVAASLGAAMRRSLAESGLSSEEWVSRLVGDAVTAGVAEDEAAAGQREYDGSPELQALLSEATASAVVRRERVRREASDRSREVAAWVASEKQK